MSACPRCKWEEIVEGELSQCPKCGLNRFRWEVYELEMKAWDEAVRDTLNASEGETDLSQEAEDWSKRFT